MNCHLKVKTTDLPTIKETVISQLEDHFSFDSENVAILATAVDPKYKDLNFVKNEELEEVKKVLLEKIAVIKERCEAEMTTRFSTEEPNAKKKDENKTAMSLLLGAANSTPSTDEDKSGKAEYEQENYSYTMMNVHYHGGNQTKSGFL